MSLENKKWALNKLNNPYDEYVTEIKKVSVRDLEIEKLYYVSNVKIKHLKSLGILDKRNQF